MNIHFGDENFYKLERQNGLLYVTLQVIYEGSPTSGTDVKFVLDTGAYLTVISRGVAMRRGLDKLPKKTTTLYGFGGGIKADFVYVPGFNILGKLRTQVPVLIPHDLYRISPETGEKIQTQDVLGLNILEYYNYYIDTEHDKLYLSNNPNPRFYARELKSGQVYLANNEQINFPVESNNIELTQLNDEEKSILKYVSASNCLIYIDLDNKFITNTGVTKEICDKLVKYGFLYKKNNDFGCVYCATEKTPKVDFTI